MPSSTRAPSAAAAALLHHRQRAAPGATAAVRATTPPTSDTAAPDIWGAYDGRAISPSFSLSPRRRAAALRDRLARHRLPLLPQPKADANRRADVTYGRFAGPIESRRTARLGASAVSGAPKMQRTDDGVARAAPKAFSKNMRTAPESMSTTVDTKTNFDRLVEPARASDGRVLLLGQTEAVIASLLAGAATSPAGGLPPYRASQVFDAIYRGGVRSLDDITTLSKAERHGLAQQLAVGAGRAVSEARSTDGTMKWLLAFDDRRSREVAVECVFIPDQARREGAPLVTGTVCVSSQKLLRNLTAGEIVAQVLHAMRARGDLPLSVKRPRAVTNVVLMGQGEPLYNYRNVRAAVELFTTGLGLSPHRTTLSTSGVAPLMGRVGQDLGCGLAVSLHAVSDDLRSELVPLNRTHPLRDVLAGARDYLAAMRRRGAARRAALTLEYVLLAGVNDTLADARELARIARSLPALVNLIPFNPWPGAAFRAPDSHAVARFHVAVKDAGADCTIRQARGRDVLGACGQLRSSEELKARVAAASQANAEQDRVPGALDV
ncbi:hypothetical protein HK405_003437 [Cladochytrium tenue]|nr:hypothetical protein HK405_003437 [Cladochytrium tenue]